MSLSPISMQREKKESGVDLMCMVQVVTKRCKGCVRCIIQPMNWCAVYATMHQLACLVGYRGDTDDEVLGPLCLSATHALAATENMNKISKEKRGRKK
ncbi:predicted protein [Coccidioides posadasii str. Silveira]|uniref:Predicted protein n=1 Tax=Coccidioides posadasii (strain RMSCC 757 / Silveira) TaxID=443226 RepID=E9D155_COCPS|nr:predicted protein [Coccidioides posadasii str. Silveira]